MDYTHADEYWRFHTTKAERMDVTLYLKLIEIFCETGGNGRTWSYLAGGQAMAGV